MERFFLCLAIWGCLVMFAVWGTGRFIDSLDWPDDSVASWERLGDRR